MDTIDVTYHGWKNYSTWNVALWIQNDESLYDLAKSCKRARFPYKAFINELKDLLDTIRTGEEKQSIYHETPDGIAWNTPTLDIDALDSMIKEL